MSDKPDWGERIATSLGLKPAYGNYVKLVVIAVGVGVLFMSAGDLFGITDTGGRRPPNASEVLGAPGATSKEELARLEESMARDLETTLSAIRGAGKVRVSLTLESGPSEQPVLNTQDQQTTTHEKAGDNSLRDTQTTTRNTTNVMVQDGNTQSLAVAKRTRAQVAGVVVVAEGARVPAIKKMIFDAVVTRLHIPANRVDVIPAEGGR